MRTVLAVVAVLVALGGCGPAGAGPPGAGDGTSDVLDGSWRLTGAITPDGRLDLAPGRDVTLDVVGREVRGVSACNHYFATVRPAGTDIRFAGIGGTEMGCEPDVMAVEQQYLAALAVVDGATARADGLVLTGPEVRLEYAPLGRDQDAALVGTVWHLETLLDGDVASSAAGDGTLELGDNGRLDGTAGCLPFEGGFATAGERIRVTGLRTPGGMTDCSLQSQHDAVLTILAAEPAFGVEGSTLTLAAADGQGLVYRANP
jgi:heat shock protein HslJ